MSRIFDAENAHLEASRPRLLIVAAIGLGQILAWGCSYYLIAVAATPIAADTGWAPAWVVGGLSLGLLVSGLIAPRVGRLIERHGGRPVLATSAVLLAAGLVLAGLAPNLAVFMTGWVVIGAGMGCGLYDPAFSALGRLYGEGARGAITQVTLFGGFSSTVCWPLSAFLVAHVGWRGTCLVYAAIMLALVLPLYLLCLPREPRSQSARPGAAGAHRPGQLRPGQFVPFLLLAAGLTLAYAIMTVIAVELLALLQAFGLTLAAAVGLGTLLGPSQVGARVLEMALGRKTHPIWSMLASTVLVAIGLALLAVDPAVAAAGIVLYGAGSGIRSIVRGTVPLALFGAEGYAVLMGRLGLADPARAGGLALDRRHLAGPVRGAHDTRHPLRRGGREYRAGSAAIGDWARAGRNRGLPQGGVIVQPPAGRSTEQAMSPSAPSAAPAQPPEISSLQTLLPLMFSFAPNRILASAIQLRVFPEIAAGRATLANLAASTGTNARALRMLLDALTGMALLDKSDGQYHLTELAGRHLLPASPDYIGTILETDDVWESWSGLADTIRAGQPPAPRDKPGAAEEFFSRLVRGLHVANYPVAQRAAEALRAGTDRAGLEIIDIGCGSGVWGIAVAQADPTARLTLQDLPGVLDRVTRAMVARYGLSDRTRYRAGSYHEMDLGTAEYDLAILGNIIHMESAEGTHRLFQLAARALRPGGRLAIIDMFPNDERTGPFFPLMFALNMLVATSHGDTYTLAELRLWLSEAGFSGIETFDIGHHSPLLVARK